MKKTLFLLSACLFLTVASTGQNLPKASHVILIGLDGVGTYGFQRAATPSMNQMVKDGALGLNFRCVLESSSSQNWMTMLTGAFPIQHGVTSNDWLPEHHAIEPVLKNKAGFFPSVFDAVRAGRPSSRIYFFYEWDGLGRMFDLTVPDKVVLQKDGVKTLTDAVEAFFRDKPEFLFVDVDETDHAGHVYGHESQEYFDCISKYDNLIGKLVERLKREGLLNETVILITGDHGGISRGHGGETPNEMEIPILLFGGPVTKGRILEKPGTIADVAPTVAGLLGVKLPAECLGRFIGEAFEPKTDKVYAPMPVILPRPAFYKDPVTVTLRADSPEAAIYYTTDGSEPDSHSTLYKAPFKLNKSAVVKAMTVVGHSTSRSDYADFRIADPGQAPGVHYRVYENYNGNVLPDFRTLPKYNREGFVHEFSLEEWPAGNKSHLAAEFESSLAVARAGKYRFTLTSDDGARLWIDGKSVAENDRIHGSGKKICILELTKGKHAVKVEYFNQSGDAKLELTWSADSRIDLTVPGTK